ncbi:MAG: primosomal protein N' [Planctomycetota bacterium]|nr:primosomal protein N' [Planctomycetota bacterium]
MSDPATLFPHLEDPAPLIPAAPAAPRPAGPFAAVALEQGIDRLLDYSIPARLMPTLQIGQRVRVPLGKGNRATFGYVVAVRPTSDYPKIKSILAIEDDRVLVPPAMMELSRWMSRYYATPLGIVLESVIPAAVKKRIGLGYNRIVRLAKDAASTQEILEKTKAPKRRAVLARLLQLEKEAGIDLLRLAGESGATPATIRKMVGLGLISIRSEVDLAGLTNQMPIGDADEKSIQLNEDQQRVFDLLSARLNAGGFSVNLLHGVTGSGKTEIYLQCIAQAVASGKRALVLVPEIALTPQTVRRFMARFQNVAVLHSGLGATQRHRFWQQIRQGRADVVVGARSSIFAPLPDLGVIVVDEEHEASYKQDQAPRYHARDVAIKRAQLENIPIILGSATPSLEIYWRATRKMGDEPGQGKMPSSSSMAYHYLSLPRRVRGLAMSAVELVDMRNEKRQRRGVHLISQRMQHLLTTTLARGHQAIILLNRRGYSNFVYCPSCANVIKCKYCDATMTYHRAAGVNVGSAASAKGVHTGQLHCHYCLAVNPLPEDCPVCHKRLTLFGLGTQRVEEELKHKFPDLKFARVDSDTMRTGRDYELLLDRFGKGEIQVMLGTQMIAKGLDYPNVTLVGVISGDTALALPDFRAAERTFQLITQVAGRAGRGDAPGRVVLQTFLPDDPTIQAALRQDYAGFAREELKHRREVGLPPFARMARFIVRHEDQNQMHKISQDLTEQLTAAITQTHAAVRLRGPMPCPIARIAGHYRNQIVLNSQEAGSIQEVIALLRSKGAFAKAESVAVDVDPVSLL